jgi:quinol monooxygenase YgiN
MICLTAIYIAKPGNEEEIARLLQIMTGHTRQESGCLFYQAHRSRNEPSKFLLYEQYTDEAALDAHRAAPYFKEYILGQVVPMLESRTPELYDPL